MDFSEPKNKSIKSYQQQLIKEQEAGGQFKCFSVRMFKCKSARFSTFIETGNQS